MMSIGMPYSIANVTKLGNADEIYRMKEKNTNY